MLNLIDREKETREQWETLKTTVSTWKDQTYTKLGQASKLEEHIKMLNELMEGGTTNENLEAGDAFANAIETLLSSSGRVPSG